MFSNALLTWRRYYFCQCGSTVYGSLLCVGFCALRWRVTMMAVMAGGILCSSEPFRILNFAHHVRKTGGDEL